MLLFGGLFGAAVIYRNKPAMHKRLIVAATVSLAFAAVGRMNLAPPIFFFVWMAPMAALAAFDVISTRRVHKVTANCGAVLTIAFFRILLVESEGWLAIGRALLRPIV